MSVKLGSEVRCISLYCISAGVFVLSRGCFGYKGSLFSGLALCWYAGLPGEVYAPRYDEARQDNMGREIFDEKEEKFSEPVQQKKVSNILTIYRCGAELCRAVGCSCFAGYLQVWSLSSLVEST